MEKIRFKAILKMLNWHLSSSIRWESKDPNQTACIYTLIHKVIKNEREVMVRINKHKLSFVSYDEAIKLIANDFNETT